MSKVIKFFVEFKSIFTGEDVLKENEEHSNIVTATIMFNISILALIIYFLTVSGVFNVNQKFMLGVAIRSIFILFIPAIIAFILRGKGKYLKVILLTLLTIGIALIYSILSYTATLLLVIPVLLAARYYSKKLTIFVAIVSIILFGISTYMSLNIGLIDLNYVELPKGTTLTIETNIEDAIKELDLDKKEEMKYIILNSYLPNLLLFTTIIAFACVQVSQSGKKMVDRQKELSDEGARIESELNIAKGIQKHMLPSTFPVFPEHKEFDIYAQMTPAKEVGGDFYDMFLIDENHLALVIADVSGKGVPAALIMMTARTLIKNTALNGYSVDEVYNKVNSTLCEGNSSNHFVTSWFGILDLTTGKLEFVNAGHNAPLIYSKKRNTFEYLRTKPNLVLAISDDTIYEKHEIMLEQGDKLFLYTDGVTESTNEENKLYGEQRLIDYLNNHIELDVTATIKGVKEDIDSFVGKREQFDDITMLEFLLKEKKGESK